METLVFPTQDQLTQHQEYWNKRMGDTPPRRGNSGLYRSSSSDLSASPLSGLNPELRPSTAGGRVTPRRASPAKNGYNNNNNSNKGNKSGYVPKPNNTASRNKIPNSGARVLENKERKGLVKKNGSVQRKDEGSSPPKVTILQRPTCPEDAMVGLATITGMSLSEVYRVYEQKGMSPPVDVLKQEVVKQVNKVTRDGEANNVKKVNRDGEVNKVNRDGQSRKTNDVNKVSKAFNDGKASPKEMNKGGEGFVEETLVKVKNELQEETHKQKDRLVVKKTVITTEESLITPIKTNVVKAAVMKAAVEIAEKYQTPKYVTPEAVTPEVTPVKEEELAARDFFLFEKWAGPAFTNSPPPSSLPVPSFIGKRKEFRVPDVEIPQIDTEAATRGLRRILNLDF